jgi:hypothetical protein
MTQPQGANLKTIEWGGPGAPRTVLLVQGITGRAEGFRSFDGEDGEASTLPQASPVVPGWFLALDLRGQGAFERDHRPRERHSGARSRPPRARRPGRFGAGGPNRAFGWRQGRGLPGRPPPCETLGPRPHIRRLRRDRTLFSTHLSNVSEDSFPPEKPTWSISRTSLPSRTAGTSISNTTSPVAFSPEMTAASTPPLISKLFGKTARRCTASPYLWSRLQCPTLILLSTVGLTNPGEGFIVPPDDARRMPQTIPGGTLVEVEHTNHYDILYSAPETAVEATRNFLANL